MTDYYEKYIKYKKKYVTLKYGGTTDRYNKNYNRSGIIPYFIKDAKIFLMMTHSIIGKKNIISDFGGVVDDYITSPKENAFREYLEESTYLKKGDVKDKSKIIENNNMLENCEELKDKISKDDYIVLFNKIGLTKNYLYLVEITDPKYIKWNTNIDLTYGDIQYINIFGNNLNNEINDIVVVKYEHIPHIKDRVRCLIYDTITQKYSLIFRAITKLDKYKKRDLIEEKNKNDNVKDCTFTKDLCDIKYEPSQFFLNDTIKHNFACTLPQIDKLTNIQYITLPQGFYFYKTITLDPLNNDEISNNFANDYSWYGDLMTAISYMSWYNKEKTPTHKLYPYKLVHEIRLIDIGNANNLEYLYKIINNKIKKIIAEHTTNIDSQYDRMNTLNRYLNQLKYIRYTTGYKMTWTEQLKLLDKNGLKKSIIKRKRNLPQNIERCKLGNTIYGDQYFDLNRVSPTLGADKILMSAVCEHINVDGYYSRRVQSYWHLNNVFNSEIAVCLSRGVLTIDTTNLYYDENNQKYKDAIELAKNIFKPNIRYDIIMMDIPYAVSIGIEKIKELYKDYHIVLFTTEKRAEMIDAIKKEKLYEYVYRLIYEITDIKQLFEHSTVENLGIGVGVYKICSSDKKFSYNCS